MEINKKRLPGFRSAARKLEIHIFNMEALRDVRADAITRESRTSYVIPARTVLAETAGVVGNIVVVPVFGFNAAELDYEEPHIYSEVHPNHDGERVACLMMADGKVALTHMAAHWANLSLYDDVHVLWIFDDIPIISQYYISDDVLEQMNQSNAVEANHKFLTRAERVAWKKLASEAQHIGYFTVIDLTEIECSLQDDVRRE
ncbi:hypothetical protein [Paraburkholderia tropica]|uniref:hypothetical protein n=1 Tax=Paraburkholderia tropica TaxID=92647 RepID=UPI002ABDE76A|nr:hypothetical protein [Paraburkholderia tropica]